MLRRIFIQFFICLCALKQVSAQGWITPMNLSERAPSTPNAAALGKYFDYPVNFATGLPDIQIPLYTVRSGNITLPIVLKYHSGGMGMNENATWVGMGWSLDVGGSVTKRVNGLDDFMTTMIANPWNSSPTVYNYFTTDDYANAVSCCGAYTMPFNSITQAVDTAGYIDAHLYNALGIRVYEGKIDGEADDYFFSTPEGGGRFIYNQKTGLFQTDRIGAWKIMFADAPGKPGNGSGGTNTSWDITNPAGTVKYEYGANEISMDARVPQDAYARGPDVLATLAQVSSNATFLSSVYDKQHNKTVSLFYDFHNLMTYAGVNQSREYYLLGSTWVTTAHDVAAMNKRWGTETPIREIAFDQGKVLFIKDTQARQDSGINALKEIRVLDKSNVLRY